MNSVKFSRSATSRSIPAQPAQNNQSSATSSGANSPPNKPSSAGNLPASRSRTVPHRGPQASTPAAKSRAAALSRSAVSRSAAPAGAPPAMPGHGVDPLQGQADSDSTSRTTTTSSVATASAINQLGDGGGTRTDAGIQAHYQAETEKHRAYAKMVVGVAEAVFAKRPTEKK